MGTEFNDINLNLEILAEECAEVIQVKSKIIRFGLDDWHPTSHISNRDALIQELGDVSALIDILVDNEIFTFEQINKAKKIKLQKLENWYRGI